MLRTQGIIRQLPTAVSTAANSQNTVVRSLASAAQSGRLGANTTNMDLRAAQTLSNATRRNVMVYNSAGSTESPLALVRPCNQYSNGNPPLKLVSLGEGKFDYAPTLGKTGGEALSLTDIQQKETTLQGLLSEKDQALLQSFSDKTGKTINVNGAGTGKLLGVVRNNEAEKSGQSPLILMLNRAYSRVHSQQAVDPSLKKTDEALSFHFYCQDVAEAGPLKDIEQIYAQYLKNN